MTYTHAFYLGVPAQDSLQIELANEHRDFIRKEGTAKSTG